jgi:hypothetical protein
MKLLIAKIIQSVRDQCVNMDHRENDTDEVRGLKHVLVFLCQTCVPRGIACYRTRFYMVGII